MNLLRQLVNRAWLLTALQIVGLWFLIIFVTSITAIFSLLVFKTLADWLLI